jgi:hypothetical protein
MCHKEFNFQLKITKMNFSEVSFGEVNFEEVSFGEKDY